MPHVFGQEGMAYLVGFVVVSVSEFGRFLEVGVEDIVGFVDAEFKGWEIGWDSLAGTVNWVVGKTSGSSTWTLSERRSPNRSKNRPKLGAFALI
jgi:hypothetical protein